MGDSPEERRSKDAVPEPSAKEAETGKGKKEKKEKSAEGSKPRPASSQRGSLTKSHMGVPLTMGAPAAKPTMRFMPTYRLESKNPLNKERVENIIKAVMNRHYNDEYMFHPKHSLHMAAQVSEEIKNRIKLDNYDRYRYIVLVTVGEFLMQGLYSMVNFLWDAEKDGFVTYSVERPSYFAVCTTFYLYYD
ncbi:dynein light chain Tctex-type protein 2B [Drosophila teissieri]|uniref:dynein light chain Tctex-type protein 2B n=1 Tax=Drosophila teissieri TaxID=7243 RepID=UPI001CB9FE31|nr:dynein light chain Tctex-type protein 2B [Drosophila teissieri]